MTWKEFIQHNLDKILLILIFHGIMVLMVSNLTNATLVDWLKGEAQTVLGAVLMLITGRATKPEPNDSTTVTVENTKKADASSATAQSSATTEV